MSPPKRGPADRAAADPNGVGYADAMVELEQILDELERDQLDVDVLADRVRRASELLTLCRDRISRAQADVDKIVADLDEFEVSDDMTSEMEDDEGY